MPLMHAHTRNLVVGTILSLALILVPVARWRTKSHDHYLLEKSVVAALQQDIANAQPIVELKCMSTEDMERYDSGAECQRLKALLKHTKPDDRAIYVQRETDRIWFDERQELHVEHWFRFAVLTSAIGVCIELVALLLFWSANDTMTLRRETLPGNRRKLD